MSLRLVPLQLLAIATLVLRFSPVDLAVARSVFDPTLPQPWKWAWLTPWSLLYQYGEWPAWLLAAAGALCVAAAARRKRFGRLGREGLFLVLVTSLGPGVLVNLVLKPSFGRPRPRDLVEFGGAHEFVPVLGLGSSANGTSFPSGHAAMAFCLVAPAFLFANRSRAAALLSATGGILLGATVGAARILQGAHFVSDVVWSAGVVYLTALMLLPVLRLDQAPDDDEAPVPDARALAAHSPATDRHARIDGVR